MLLICFQTSYISKIWKKIVRTKVVAHLTDFNADLRLLIFLEYSNDWTLMLDIKLEIYIMYKDLEKTLESLTHENLLFMLAKAGIRGNLLTWLSNFLAGCFFKVKLGKIRSAWARVDNGVPQGFFLGPILFILFINNVSAGLNKSQIQLYADDSKLYRRADSIEQCHLFESDISALHHWLTSCQIKENFEKCEVLHLGRNSLEIQYTVNDHVVHLK